MADDKKPEHEDEATVVSQDAAPADAPASSMYPEGAEMDGLTIPSMPTVHEVPAVEPGKGQEGPRFRQTQVWIPQVKQKPAANKPAPAAPAAARPVEKAPQPAASGPTTSPKIEIRNAMPTPGPSYVPPSAIWSPSEKPKSNAGKVIVGLVAVGAIGVGSWLAFGRHAPGPAPAEPPQQTTTTQPATTQPATTQPATTQPATTQPAPAASTEKPAEPTHPTPPVEAKPATTAPAAGEVAVDIVTTPANAAVWVDKELRGTSPLHLTLKPGDHNVVALAERQKLRRETLHADGSQAKWNITLDAATLPPGLVGPSLVEVRCKSIGRFRILIDEHDTGHQCPNVERIAVTPGPHRIGLYDPMADQTFEIEKEISSSTEHPTQINIKY